MAISKQRKNELVAFYEELLGKSQALIVAEYSGLNMKQLDDLRSKIREAGGEFHVVKNTLGQVSFEQNGYADSGKFLRGSSAVAFAFQDPPAISKILAEFARTSDVVKIKGGYLSKSPMSAEQVKSLAELPPLPVMRSQLLGVLKAPAGKLVRTLAEPARQVAAVLKAYAEQDGSPDAAPTAA